MLYISWRTHVKLSWKCNCKTYFISELLAPDMSPPNVFLMTRFLSFFHSLLDHRSVEVQTLARLAARDLRTNIGSNLDHIRRETNLDPWNYGGARVKDALLQYSRVIVPKQDQWRICYLEKLLTARLEAYFAGHTEGEEYLNSLICSLVGT